MSKVLTGRNWFSTDAFNFTLTAGDTTTMNAIKSGLIEMPGETLLTITENDLSAEGAIAYFGDIVFHKTGIYQFVVKELATDPITGISYDGHTTTVTVEVTDNLQGQLEIGAEAVSTNGSMTWENHYTAEAINASLEGTKTISGREWLTSDVFTFTITAEDGAPLPGVTKVQNDSDGNIVFGPITYKEAGTYKYKITEDSVNTNGITSDTGYVEATVTINYDESTGELLISSVSYDKKETDGIGFQFINTYETEGSLDGKTNLNVTKKLTGREWLDSDSFTFILAVDANHEATVKAVDEEIIIMPPSMTLSVNKNNAESAHFDDIIFKKAGTYQFTIAEKEESIPGMTYDTAVRTIVVTAEDNKDGTLNVTASMAEGSESLVFENKYAPDKVTLSGSENLEVTKDFTGRADDLWLDTDSFTFTLKANDDITKDAIEKGIIEMLTNTEDSTDGEGIVNIKISARDEDKKAAFGDIVFHEVGTYTFVIEEVIGSIPGVTYDTIKRVVTVTVTDNKTGNLVAEATVTEGEDLTFHNVYTPESVILKGSTNLEVTKEFTGRDDDAWLDTDIFTFALEAADEVTKEAIADGYVTLPSNADDTSITDGTPNISIDKDTKDYKKAFGNITFTKAGTYKFIVREVAGTIPGMDYDATARIVTVVVNDNTETGKLEITSCKVEAASAEAASNDLTFHNKYDPEDTLLYGHDNLHVIKDLVGRDWLDTDEFIFTLTVDPQHQATVDASEAGEIILDTPTKLVVTKDNKEYAHFGNITFHRAGTYHFLISETEGSISGITYSEEVKKVIVTVHTETRDGDDFLVINENDVKIEDMNGNASDLTFTNTYTATEVTLEGETNLQVDKVLLGRDWFESDTFTFVLKAGDDKTKAAVKAGDIILPATEITVTEENKDNAYFGDVVFKKVGTYSFIISEKAGSIDNMTYAANTYTVTVDVTDNLQGSLVVATPSSYSGALEDGKMQFVNTYQPDPAEVTLVGKKVLEGREFLETDTFTFKIQAVNDAVLPNLHTATVKNVAGVNEKDIAFGPIKYTSAGTYVYKITEVIPDEAVQNAEGKWEWNGITYDTTEWTITVEVTYDNATGEFSYTVSYNSKDSFVFTNIYDAEPTDELNVFCAAKVVKPTDGNSFTMEGGEFKFTIEPSGDNPNADPVTKTTVTNNSDGKITFFSGVSYTEPGIYNYSVYEENASQLPGVNYDDTYYTITVNVTDDNVGKLHADVSIADNDGNTPDDMTFTNGYDPEDATAVLFGQKYLTGKDLTAEEFTFTVEAVDNAPMPENDTVSNDDAGHFSFSQITFDRPGTYEYIITEKDGGEAGVDYDNAKYKAVVTVEDVAPPVEENTPEEDDTLTPEEPVTPERPDENPDSEETTPGEEDVPTRTSIVGTEVASVMSGEGSEATTATEATTVETEATTETTTAATEATTETTTAATEATTEATTAVTEATTETTTAVTEATTEITTAATEVTLETTAKFNAASLDEEDTTDTEPAKDNGYGMLKASIQYYVYENGSWVRAEDNRVEFNNTYSPKALTDFTISGKKLLVGRVLLSEEFTFKLKDQLGNVLSTAKNNSTGEFKLTIPEITKAGVYIYFVEEEKGTTDGITYDEKTYTVVLTVQDMNAELVATVEVYHEGQKQTGTGFLVHFENTYKAAGTKIQLAATKVLEGRDLQAGEFEFELKDGTGQMISTATNDENGVVQFAEIAYDEAGIYKYTVTEKKGTLDNITYDESVYFVTVTVTDDLNGHLVATIDNNGEAMVFTNIYEEPVDEPDDSDKDEPDQDDKDSEDKSKDKADDENMNKENKNKSPKTKDESMLFEYGFLAAASLVMMVTILIRRRKEENNVE